uniref:ABC transporter ATP-binding protein n=1 Tax=Alistipes sp. TaxID=1872444 RepID=UPI0040572FA2
MNILFEIENLRCSYDKEYREGVSKVVLEIENLTIPKGKKVFIVGESGIGKSTILETLGMMNNTIVPNESTKFVFYADDDNRVDLVKLWSRGDKELSQFRLKHFNFIFQSTNLMRNFTAYENISLTRMLQGYSQESSFARAKQVLADLGLEYISEERMTQELSGGQQQRLAFARAIIPDFTVLFGDEPTGNLDSDNAKKAMEILSNKLTELNGASAVIVSHDMHLAATFADTVIKINKVERPRVDGNDEVVYYGLINDDSIFVPNEERRVWSNGKSSYEAQEFEKFLKQS